MKHIGRKSKCREGIKIVGFVLGLIVLFGFVSQCMVICDVENVCNVKGFYNEPDESLDVVLIGQSELYTGFSSTLAYRDYGFTSYNLAVGGVPCNMNTSILKEVVKHQHPKLLVVNAQGYLWGDWSLELEYGMRRWLDNIPISRNWITTIEEKIPEEKRMEYLMTWSKYHNSWKQWKLWLRCNEARFGSAFFDKSYLKGTSLVAGTNHGTGTEEVASFTFSNKMKKELQEFIDFAHAQGIKKILFVAFPHQERNTAESQAAMEQFSKVIEANGEDFLNLDKGYETFGIADNYDFSNAQHLNVRGMEKCSNYLANYIVEHYDIKPNHEKHIKRSWEDAVRMTEAVLKKCRENTDAEDGTSHCEIDAIDMLLL